jgi:opacity protein-like surface antigen
MTARHIALIAISTLGIPAIGWAQDQRWTPEISAAVGFGHVFRFDDETFGDPLNAGAAVAIAHRSGWAFELEADRVFGLEPKLAPCGLVDNTCMGSGRYGPREATVASLGIQYRFRGGRVQPFLFAGVGVLWTASLQTTTYASSNPAVVVESETRDHGFGPDLGAGLRIALSPHVAISPEIRWLDASLLSRENLAITRLGIRATYRW